LQDLTPIFTLSSLSYKKTERHIPIIEGKETTCEGQEKGQKEIISRGKLF